MVGITGTMGAGKGEVSRYLAQRYGFTPLFVRDAIKEALQARGLPVDRDHMRELANQLRAQHGADWFVRTLLDRARQQRLDRVIIDSIRAPAEAEAVREAGGIILAVDADRRLRYERVRARASETDQVSFEEFVRQEEAELTGAAGPNAQNLAAVMEDADVLLENDGSLDALHVKLDQLMAQLRIAPQAQSSS